MATTCYTRIYRNEQYNLRQRTHTKELLNKTTELNHRDFLIRMLYKGYY